MMKSTLLAFGIFIIAQGALAQGRPSMFNQKHLRAGSSAPRPMKPPVRLVGATLQSKRVDYQNLQKTSLAVPLRDIASDSELINHPLKKKSLEKVDFQQLKFEK